LTGNGFRGGPALLSSRSSFLLFLITLFEDLWTQPIQLIGCSEVVESRMQSMIAASFGSVGPLAYLITQYTQDGLAPTTSSSIIKARLR
jgi:xanthine/uracil permease